MLLTIAGVTAATGFLGYSYLDRSSSDTGKKISRIAANVGLTVKEGKQTHTIQALRKTEYTWGTEYAYRLPLGLAYHQFVDKAPFFEDGLNAKKRLFEIDLNDLKRLKFDRTILEQIKALLQDEGKLKREVMFSFDGVLKIRVYNAPLPDVVQFTDEILSKVKGWKIYAGEAREGDIIHDFDELPHIIVAGTTRYGKSVFLKNVTTTLIHNNPKYARLHLIDLKGGLAFQRFKNVSQVSGVAKNVGEAAAMLLKVEEEMLKRERDFLEKGFEDVKESGYKYRDFIIVDEAAEISSSLDKDNKKICDRILAEIARIGGGLGYRLIYATQYPTGDVLPRQIKQNAPAKICFLLDTEVASRVVLDEAGADVLPFIPGRAIYKTDRKRIVQSPYIKNDFITEKLAPHITINGKELKKDVTSPTKANPTSRVNTIVLEDARLPDKKSNTKAAQPRGRS